MAYNKMHMNSNDIFSQIGLVVDPRAERSIQEVPAYKVYLEIQLSEGKNEFLSIKNDDDPHTVAHHFCRKHRLNELAIDIVENKIIEAKHNEQARLRDRHALKQSRKDTQQLTNSNYIEKNKQSLREKTVNQSISSIKINSVSNNKTTPQKTSPQKTTSVSKGAATKQAKSPSKANKDRRNRPTIGDELYARAMVKNKMQENERIKRQQQKLSEQQKELTFQPKINPVSLKIVQFRRQNGAESEKEKQKQNKKLAINQQKFTDEVQQIKECTFKPQINHVSEMITQNRHVYKDEYDHFVTLYRQAETRKDKLNAKIEQNQETLFQPKINTKSNERITETFEERLAKSLIRQKQLRQSVIQEEGCSFQPKICRGPKDSRHLKNVSANSSAIWNQLYIQKLKKSEAPLQTAEEETHPITVSLNSNVYYENLVEKRINQIFLLLDGDQDDLISPDSISIQRLSKHQLVFLKPIFEEMDDLAVVLDRNQFKKALLILLSDADPHSRGVFLSEKPQKEERSSFTPEINKKSKQIALSRIATVQGTIYDHLYEQGLKEMQKKEYKLQRERTKLQQKQLEQCSFKPHLNSTSKYYISKVLGKRIHEKNQDQ